MIFHAISQLGEEYEQELADRISLTPTTLSRWKAIGQNQIIQKNKSKMPSAMGSLYAITVLEGILDSNHGTGTGQTRIQKLIDKDQIASTTPRIFIEGKIKEQHDVAKRRKARENEKKLAALVKGQNVPDPKTLDDFITKGDRFHNIVIIPTKEQINEWMKLDFAVDIGDSYQIQEIRKTTQTQPNLCFLIISRNQFDMAIDCLRGWGFTYREIVIPDGGDFSLIIGARGNFKVPAISLKTSETDEILKLVENIGGTERIVIGAVTTRTGWAYCNG